MSNQMRWRWGGYVSTLDHDQSNGRMTTREKCNGRGAGVDMERMGKGGLDSVVDLRGGGGGGGCRMGLNNRGSQVTIVLLN